MSRAPRRLRAYALTQGRTHADSDLAMDAMVSVGANPDATALSPEQTSLLARCREAPQSLVDLSSALDVPVGIVRVLLADLLNAGVLAVHTQDANVPVQHDLALLEEVLDGIEAL